MATFDIGVVKAIFKAALPQNKCKDFEENWNKDVSREIYTWQRTCKLMFCYIGERTLEEVGNASRGPPVGTFIAAEV